MKLFTISVFKSRPVRTENEWRVSEDGTLLIRGPDGIEKLFFPLKLDKGFRINTNSILDATVRSDGCHGTIYPHKNKVKNRDTVLILIVAEADIELPDRLYYDHRVKIEPVANTEGSLVATVICFLKTEEIILHFKNELEIKQVSLSYDKETRFIKVKNINTFKSVQKKQSWFWKYLSVLCPRFQFHPFNR